MAFAALAAGIATTAAPSAASAKRVCDSVSFGTRFCATHYHVAIAGIELGDPLSRVEAVLGRPRSHVLGRPGAGNCPFATSSEFKLRPLVQTFADGLTVKLERYSHTSDICLKRHRNRERTVMDIVTTSSRDSFPNGVRVGSSLRFTKRAFRAQRIACHHAHHRSAAGSSCALAVRVPRFARRDDAIAGVLLPFRHYRLQQIELTFWKPYS
jgi:hypothetical protein